MRGGRILPDAQAKGLLSRGKYFFDLINNDSKLASGVAQIGAAIKIRGRFLEGETFVQTLYPVETGETPVCFFLKGGTTVVIGWLSWLDAQVPPLSGPVILTTTNAWTKMEFVPVE